MDATSNAYKHYVRIDVNSIVIHGFSSAFETPEPADICIDEDAGRHFTLQLTNERGQFRYKFVDGALVDRSQTDLDAEWAARPPAPESAAEKLARLEAEKAALETQMAEMNRNFTDFVDFYFTNNPEQS